MHLEIHDVLYAIVVDNHLVIQYVIVVYPVVSTTEKKFSKMRKNL